MWVLGEDLADPVDAAPPDGLQLVEQPGCLADGLDVAAHDLLTRYIALVPTLAEPHFVLAQLDVAQGDTTAAAVEAEKGRASYTSDLETAKRAAVYYENALDLTNAAFFLSEVVRLEPTNTAAAQDLLKIQTYERSRK